MEHMRPNGLSQGYFCTTCGEVVAMYGHRGSKCIPNKTLVDELKKLNSKKTELNRDIQNVED